MSEPPEGDFGHHSAERVESMDEGELEELAEHLGLSTDSRDEEALRAAVLREGSTE